MKGELDEQIRIMLVWSHAEDVNDLHDRSAQSVNLGSDVRIVHLLHGGEEVVNARHAFLQVLFDERVVADGRPETLDALCVP